MKRYIYFGPPGTGKTTTLLERLTFELKQGVDIERIAFLTFTRRARHEAVTRVSEALGYVPKNLPHFRTIHSMAYRALGLKTGDVIGRAQLTAFGVGMGLTFGGSALSEQAAEGIQSQNKGDMLLALDNLARLRERRLKQVWEHARVNITWTEVDHFSRSYAAYKADTGLLDFTDVLTEFVRAAIELPIDVCFIDEAQDLSLLQWRVALQAAYKAGTQYVAGDDDQAIYRWAGADVDEFMQLGGERIVLARSYRLPRAVHALSMNVIKRVKTRVPKEFAPRDDDGLVKHASSAEQVASAIEEKQKWLWLVRNRYLLAPLRQSLESRGLVYTTYGNSSINATEREAIYTWTKLSTGHKINGAAAREMYDMLRGTTQVARGFKKLPGLDDEDQVSMQELREHFGLLCDGTWYEVLSSIPESRRYYYRQLLRMHRTLKIEPQVQLETIHGAKGAEADNVALFLEQSRRTYEESQLLPDDEHRVFYVGVTRARHALYLVQPGSRWGYGMA